MRPISSLFDTSSLGRITGDRLLLSPFIAVLYGDSMASHAPPLIAPAITLFLLDLPFPGENYAAHPYFRFYGVSTQREVQSRGL